MDVGSLSKKYSAFAVKDPLLAVPTTTLPLTANVVPSKVKFGSLVAVLDVPFAVNTLLFVVGEIEVNPAP
jgi:hypothetical protein